MALFMRWHSNPQRPEHCGECGRGEARKEYRLAFTICGGSRWYETFPCEVSRNAFRAALSPFTSNVILSRARP